VLDLVDAGRKIAEVAHDLGISEQRSTRGDVKTASTEGSKRGCRRLRRPSLSRRAKRIRELEAELAVRRRATELLKEDVGPKGGSRPST
jgi:hypothetical protein